MKRILSTLILALAVGIAGSAAAAEWPQKPITLIVPFNAGGNTDVVARSIVPYLEKELKTTIIVKNVTGAGATLGTAELAQARPDGYTLGWLPTGPVSIQPSLRALPYTLGDLTPIALVTSSPYVVMVDKKAPWNNLADLDKDLKANPNKYAYGSSGPGTLPHLAMAALVKSMNGEMKHIPDRSTADGMKALAGGTIQFFADTPSILARFDVKPLALFQPERIASLPDLSTAKEQGYDLTFAVWNGIFGPKNLPADITDKVAAAIKNILAQPAYQEFAAKSDIELKFMGPAEFASFLTKETEANKRIIEQSGLQTN